jgi:hypothetical protein
MCKDINVADVRLSVGPNLSRADCQSRVELISSRTSERPRTQLHDNFHRPLPEIDRQRIDTKFAGHAS